MNACAEVTSQERDLSFDDEEHDEHGLLDNPDMLQQSLSFDETDSKTTTTHTMPLLADADRIACCPVCSKKLLPFKRSRGLSQNALWERAALGWDCEDGFLDILRLVNEYESNIPIPKDLARQIVESTNRHLRDLKMKLMEAGLQKHSDQNFTAESVNAARIVAPFDANEVQVGRLLGTGGFSSVSAVNGFTLQTRSTRRTLSRNEELSRKYLADHAMDTVGSSSKDKKPANVSAHTIVTTCSTSYDPLSAHEYVPPYDDTYTRYAIKNLRPTLLHQSHEKFHRAAVDLVLEGQLLMVLDHPNIVSIRGWSADGPSVFQNCVASDYFLIIDRLPQTLEDKVELWRTQLTKYRKCWRRHTARKNLKQKLSTWFRGKRQQMLQQHVNHQRTKPNKYAAKLQKMLLDQLRAAHGLASAMSYIHSKRMIHRDIKGSNIGFDIHGETKIFDFGLARLLPRATLEDEEEDSGGSNYEVFRMSRVGTKFYMSPEVLLKEPYGTPSDVYSFGVVLWEIFALCAPRDVYQMQREAYEKAEQKKRESKYDFPKLRRDLKAGVAGLWLPVCPCWPEAIRTLIESCMTENPKQRPTMQHVCSVLEREMERVSASLQQSSYVPRRRSTFRLDLSKLHMLPVGSEEERSQGHDHDDLCCETSTTTNLTASPCETNAAIFGPGIAPAAASALGSS